MFGAVTTATVWVCGKCGAVSHIDGGVQPSWVTHGFCGASVPIETNGAHGAAPIGPVKHALKPVLVLIPYA